MNAVLDTNIFISGIFWARGASRKIIEAWRKGEFILITSLPLVNELIGTLEDFKIRMHEEMIRHWENMVIENSIVVQPTIKLQIAKDPDDDKFIETALAGNADFIVSQDKHLLEIKKYHGIRILHPKEFVKILG